MRKLLAQRDPEERKVLLCLADLSTALFMSAFATYTLKFVSDLIWHELINSGLTRAPDCAIAKCGSVYRLHRPLQSSAAHCQGRQHRPNS